MASSLYSPTVLVNNVPIAIKPNSFSFTEGNGERKVRIASTGGKSLKTIFSEDLETKFSTNKFTMLTDSESVADLKTWLSNEDKNVVQVSERGFSRTFQNAIVTNNPESALGVDGEIEVEWQSSPAI